MAEAPICRADGCVNISAVDDLGLCKSHLKALVEWQGRISIAVPTCTVASCTNDPKSAYWPYCQMHDARLRRHGHLGRKEMADAIYHSHGYKLILAQGHPMARGARAYEHRVVYYDAHPDGPDNCCWCGDALTWATLQVDHLNAVRDDNRLSNLVAACGDCNRDRAKPAAAKANRARAKGHMVNGRWLSIADAARALRIAPSSIELRLANGWTVERAMTETRGRFGPKRDAA